METPDHRCDNFLQEIILLLMEITRLSGEPSSVHFNNNKLMIANPRESFSVILSRYRGGKKEEESFATSGVSIPKVSEENFKTIVYRMIQIARKGGGQVIARVNRTDIAADAETNPWQIIDIYNDAQKNKPSLVLVKK